MKIVRYGITLELLNESHLEMVRAWRNADHVRTNMEYQELISEEAQQAWFEQLDPKCNFYAVMSTRDLPFGLIHIKNIDWEKSSGEAGIFVGDASFLQTSPPMLAILVLMDLAFHLLGLNLLQAKIQQGNSYAQDFNQKLGYRLAEGQEGNAYQYYEVNKATYLQTTHQIRQTATKMHGGQTRIIGEGRWRQYFQSLDEEGKAYLHLL